MADTRPVINPFTKKLYLILSIINGGSPSTGTDFILDGGAYNVVNVDIIDAGTAEASGDFICDGGTL